MVRMTEFGQMQLATSVPHFPLQCADVFLRHVGIFATGIDGDRAANAARPGRRLSGQQAVVADDGPDVSPCPRQLENALTTKAVSQGRDPSPVHQRELRYGLEPGQHPVTYQGGCGRKSDKMLTGFLGNLAVKAVAVHVESHTDVAELRQLQNFVAIKGAASPGVMGDENGWTLAVGVRRSGDQAFQRTAVVSKGDGVEVGSGHCCSALVYCENATKCR